MEVLQLLAARLLHYGHTITLSFDVLQKVNYNIVSIILDELADLLWRQCLREGIDLFRSRSHNSASFLRILVHQSVLDLDLKYSQHVCVPELIHALHLLNSGHSLCDIKPCPTLHELQEIHHHTGFVLKSIELLNLIANVVCAEALLQPSH